MMKPQYFTRADCLQLVKERETTRFHEALQSDSKTANRRPLRGTADGQQRSFGSSGSEDVIEDAGKFTNENITAWNTLTQNSSIVFTLFIGYLIEGAVAHPRSFYVDSIGPWAAFICIQGRAIAAIAGTASQFLVLIIEYQFNSIMSQPVGNDRNSTVVAEAVYIEAELGLLFLKRMEPITQACRYISWLCLAEFVVAFSIGLIAFESGDGNMLAFMVVAITIMVSTIYLLWYIIDDGKRTINRANWGNDQQHIRPDAGGSSI